MFGTGPFAWRPTRDFGIEVVGEDVSYLGPCERFPRKRRSQDDCCTDCEVTRGREETLLD